MFVVAVVKMVIIVVHVHEVVHKVVHQSRQVHEVVLTNYYFTTNTNY